MADFKKESREVRVEGYIEGDGEPSEVEVGEITVTINADVSEAITGLKTLQRELRETTKAVREYEAAMKDAVIEIDGKEIARTVVKEIEKEERIKSQFR